MRTHLAGIVLLALALGSLRGQTTPAAPDVGLAQARGWIGRALFLRGFYAANDLRYDESGRLQGAPPKVVDWTLAGMDVQTVERKSPEAIELDGLRVAIRYNRDNRLFERHPQKEDHIKILLVAGPRGEPVAKALDAIFAVGIDPAMQRAMPEAWRHYFDPRLAWPRDEFDGQKIFTVSDGKDGRLVYPTPAHRVDAAFSSAAERDRVQGKVGLSLVVDSRGAPQRVAISDPLGYGLDARAAEAVVKWTFTPGTFEGRPVAAAVQLTEEFVLVPVRP